MGRPRSFDRDVALDAAMIVFWRKGFQAASMNDLCDAMGIRSPSLYAAFGSKEALYLEVMKRYEDTVTPAVREKLAASPTAREGVESFLMAAAENLPECEAMPGGCMSTLAALGEACPGAIPEIIKKSRLDSLDVLRAKLADAAAAGELPPSTDIEQWSRFYLSVFQGMAVQAHDGATADQLIGVVQSAMRAWPSAPIVSAA